MSQQILCWDDRGIVVGSDSRVIYEFNDIREIRERQKKIYQLANYSFISTVGAFVGIEIADALQKEIARQGLQDIEDIAPFSIDFLNQRYYEFLVRFSGWFRYHPSAYKLLYFTIGGYSTKQDRPLVYCLESVDNEIPFRQVPLGKVFTLPRLIGLEARLIKQLEQQQLLEKLAQDLLEYLQVIRSRNEDVGEPFQVALVNKSGLYFISDW